MKPLTIAQAQRQSAKKPPRLLALAIKEPTRGELASIGILLLLYIIMTVTFPISSERHDAGLQMRVTSVGTFARWRTSSGT